MLHETCCFFASLLTTVLLLLDVLPGAPTKKTKNYIRHEEQRQKWWRERIRFQTYCWML